jgi:cell division septum initiation protein DivIVA
VDRVGRKFRTALFGYVPGDVSARIAQLEAEFSARLGEKQETEGRLREDNQELLLEIKRLQAQIDEHRSRQAALAGVLTAARAEAAEIGREAMGAAEELKADALARVSAAREEFSGLKAIHSLFLDSLCEMLARYEAEARVPSGSGTRQADSSGPAGSAGMELVHNR